MVATEQELAAAALWPEYKLRHDRATRDKLINQYYHLVKYTAGRMAISLPPHLEFADLVSYGVFGLLEAIERFDYQRGIKFETYCIARIRGSIIDGLRALDWVPQSVKKRRREIEAAYAQLEHELGRAATDQEMAAFLGLSREQFGDLLSKVSYTAVVSLDDLLGDAGDGEGLPLRDSIPDLRATDPAGAAELSEVRRLLAQAIERLPEKERLVVTLFYYEGLLTKEIALVLHLSESRISQLHTKAVLRLRGSLSRQKKNLVG